MGAATLLLASPTPAGAATTSRAGTGVSTRPPRTAPASIPRVSLPSAPGYWLADPAGRVTAGGAVPFSGATRARAWNAPVVSMTPTPDARGYWLAAADGEVQGAGDAAVYGPPPPSSLNRPVVGMAATPDGAGYWLVASDGGIFTFGAARFYGSTGAMRLNRPITAMLATPDGAGYWLVASDGGVFTFGDARYHGSTGNQSLSAPVVGAAATPDGAGYWLTTAAGRVYPFGDATPQQPAASTASSAAAPADTSDPAPVVGIAATSDGGGYWLAHSDGEVAPFGDAGLGGGSAAPAPAGGIVAVAAPGPPPAATRAAHWALAQIGKPYVYGGTGPDGFDCSGLVMSAYGAVGIHLPRVAQDQYDAGPLLAAGATLEPGDVVFFGTPSGITHDGIYVGNGNMVDAPHTGATVRVEPFQWPDYVGASRPL